MATPLIPLLTTEEARAYLRLSRNTFYRLAARGKLRVIRVGGVLRVRLSELEKYLDRQTGK
jgi:excisionase family DNA binding protein